MIGLVDIYVERSSTCGRFQRGRFQNLKKEMETYLGGV